MSMFFNEEISRAFREATTHMNRVEVTLDGEIYDDTYYGGDKILLSGSAGSFNYDRNSEVRSQGQLSLLANGEDAVAVLSPLAGARITAYSGIMVEGSPYWQPLGTFIVADYSFAPGGWATRLDLRLVDLSELVRGNPWKSPFQTGGISYREAIEDILDDRVGVSIPRMITYEYAAEECPVVTYTEQDDPWSSAYKLAQASLSDLYFSREARLVLEEIAEIATQDPVYTFGTDEYRVETQRRVHSVALRETYNGVICTGDAPWLLFPIRGEAWDENPASETWRYGRLGERPYRITDAVATTDAQCQAIAEKEFIKRAGVTETIEINQFLDPILREGMPIALADRPKDEYYVIDSISLTQGRQMAVTARRKRR